MTQPLPTFSEKPKSDSGFVALVGCPNSGKTTLFNRLTLSQCQAVNYPGATVDYCHGSLAAKFGGPLEMVDTPGTYSLFPKSPEEQVAKNVLYDRPGVGPAQLVVVVVDSTQLSRHLFLVEQLREASFRLVVALTMSDILQKNEEQIDERRLSEHLGCPVVSVSGATGEGMEDLADCIRKEFEKPIPSSPVDIPNWTVTKAEEVLQRLGILAQSVRVSNSENLDLSKSKKDTTAWLDGFLLHRIWGGIIFVGIMALIFSSIFWAATPLMEWVDTGFSWLADWVVSRSPDSLWADLLGNGVIASFGAVLVFVPQVAILFMGITLLEDSGYLARAASIIDRPLSQIGLNGRSFVPLLSGYACAIPAMLAARTISSRKERWLTLFIIPLMSCSARLPVYALLLAFLFVDAPAWQPGLILAFIYLSSLVVGSLVAALVNRMVKFEGPSFFLMELPKYRKPQWSTVLKNVQLKTTLYVKKAGPPIFIFAIVFWALSTFPNFKAEDPNVQLKDSYAAQMGRVIEPVMEPLGGDWRTGTALISAFTAREVFVSALVIVFNVSGDSDESIQTGLLNRMREARGRDGYPLFTTSSIIGLLIFFMISLQCIATVGVARREFGNWHMPVIQLVAFNLLGYALAVLAVQGLRAFGVA